MKFSLVFALFLLASTNAQAAEIRLKDGSIIVGTILSLADGDDLVVDTAYMDAVTIEWRAIASIEGTQVVDVELFDGTRMLGTVTFGNYGVNIVGEDTMDVEPAEVFSISEVNETFWEAIDAYTDLGMNVVRGNNQVTQISFGGGLAYDVPNYELSLDITSITNEQTNAQDTRRDTLSASYLHKFSNRWQTLASYSFESDEQQSLDGRTLLSLAGGRQLTNSRRQRFSLAAGAALNSEKFAGLDREQSVEGLLNATYRLRSRVDLDVSYTYLPNLEQSGRYRTQFDATLSLDLIADFDFKVIAYDRFDSQPPAGNDNNDTGVTLALSWDL